MAYPTAIANGNEFIAPAAGEVAWADFKGTVVEEYPGYPRPIVGLHVVVTRPQAGGDQLIVASEELPFPYGGDPQRITSYDLQKLPARICVQPGDHIGMSTSGGFGNHFPQYGSFPDDFYADGAPWRMFASVPGSSIAQFEEPVRPVGDGF